MTAQFREILNMNDKEYALSCEPLEPYLNNRYPDEGSPFAYTSTACWRGYVGEWKIDNSKLYLVSMSETYGYDHDKETYYSINWREELFDGDQGDIKAYWFTGDLVIPIGEMLEYVHMGYESIFEEELIIHVQEGEVVGFKKKKNNLEEIKSKRKEFLDSFDEIFSESDNKNTLN